MAFNPENYLDIWNILVYEIIGSVELTIIIGFILIAFFSVKYMIPYQVGIMMMILYFIIIAAITKDMGYWTLVILFVGLILYGILSRKLRRG